MWQEGPQTLCPKRSLNLNRESPIQSVSVQVTLASRPFGMTPASKGLFSRKVFECSAGLGKDMFRVHAAAARVVA